MPIREDILANMRVAARHNFLSQIEPMRSDEMVDIPNIIVILMDDMGWGDLSCFGSEAIRTPNLDRLAREGVVMENCYASSPVCTPSRFGLLTGRYPCRGHIHNVYFPTCEIKENHVFAMGYDEGSGDLSDDDRRTLLERMRMIARQAGENLPTEGILEDEITIADMLKARGYRTAMFGKWHLGDKSPSLPNDKGFEYFFGAHYSNDMIPYHFWRNKEIAIEAPFAQNKITEYLNNEFFQFISQNADGPFFAYYASPWPHHPLNCGKDFAGHSKAGLYGDCIEEFDAGIGQLLDLLDEQIIREKTLIVFTSDNGPWHQGSPGGHRGRKGNCFDGGQVVPTIINWPGKIAPRKISEQAMNIDFLPTICDLAGIELPKDREIDGRSLLPLLLDQTSQSPHDVLLFINSLATEEQPQAVRSSDHFKYYKPDFSDNAAYKFIKIHSFLFDLNNDKDESYDVKMKYPAKYAELKLQLETFGKAIKINPRGWN